MAGERILVVDDRNENIDFIVEYVLKPNGYRALTARDGEEGLRKALTAYGYDGLIQTVRGSGYRFSTRET